MPKFLQPILDWWDKITARATAPSEDALAQRGESAAARYLRQIGYKIILRNYRSPLGEIDIIARDGDTLVFVEVKTRAYDDPTPEEQVNTVKQHQITKAAKIYLNRYGSSQPQRDVRRYVDLYRKGRLKLDELVSATYPLGDMKSAVHDLEAGELAARGVLTLT